MLDAKTICLFCGHLAQSSTIEILFDRFDEILRNSRYPPMSEQFQDAMLVAAPKKHNTNAEKVDLRAGRISDGWKDEPANPYGCSSLKRQRHRNKYNLPTTDFAIPFFGYKSHISIDLEIQTDSQMED